MLRKQNSLLRLPSLYADLQARWLLSWRSGGVTWTSSANHQKKRRRAGRCLIACSAAHSSLAAVISLPLYSLVRYDEKKPFTKQTNGLSFTVSLKRACCAVQHNTTNDGLECVLPFIASRLVGRTWGGLPNGIIDPTPESGGALPAASLESMNALLAYAAENNKARESSAGAIKGRFKYNTLADKDWLCT